jgi:hypothetical protein
MARWIDGTARTLERAWDRFEEWMRGWPTWVAIVGYALLWAAIIGLTWLLLAIFGFSVGFLFGAVAWGFCLPVGFC